MGPSVNVVLQLIAEEEDEEEEDKRHTMDPVFGVSFFPIKLNYAVLRCLTSQRT